MGQTPTQLLTHSHCSAEQGNRMRRLMGCDRDKEIVYQLPLQAKQTWLGENWCNLLSIKIDSGSEKQRKTPKWGLSSPLSQAELYSFNSRLLHFPLHGAGGRGNYGQSYPPMHFPCSGTVSPHGLQNFRKKTIASVWALHRLRFPRELSTCSSVGPSRVPWKSVPVQEK